MLTRKGDGPAGVTKVGKVGSRQLRLKDARELLLVALLDYAVQRQVPESSDVDTRAGWPEQLEVDRGWVVERRRHLDQRVVGGKVGASANAPSRAPHVAQVRSGAHGDAIEDNVAADGDSTGSRCSGPAAVALAPNLPQASDVNDAHLCAYRAGRAQVGGVRSHGERIKPVSTYQIGHLVTEHLVHVAVGIADGGTKGPGEKSE